MGAKQARIEQQETKTANKKKEQHPAQSASWFSRLFILWIQPFIVLGAKRPLTNDDLPELSGEWSAEECGNKIQLEWEKELRAKGKAKAWLARAVLRAFFWPYALGGLFMFISIIGTVLAPMFVRSLLSVLTAENPEEAWTFGGLSNGYVITALMTVAALVQSVFNIQNLVQTSYVGVLVRSGIMNMVFRRAVQLKRNGDSPGLVVNLLSNDTEMCFFAILMGHLLWMCPVFFIVVIVLLYTSIGVYGAGGAALCLLLVPLQSAIGKRFGKHKAKMLRHTDKRLQLTSEVLGGIQVVKTNAWERQMAKRVLDSRDEELRSHRSVLILNALNTWMLFLVPNFIGLVVFLIVIQTDPRGVDALDTATVYSTLIYINILKFPIFILPKAVATVSQGYVSAQRIGAFLKAEVEEDGTTGGVSSRPPAIGNNSTSDSISNDSSFQQKSEKETRRVVVSFNNDSFVWAKPISSLSTAKKDDEASSLPAVMGSGNKKDKPASKMVKVDLPPTSNPNTVADSEPTTDAQTTLHNLSLDIYEGELIAVVGHVGSGKSSLCAAMLDEIYRLDSHHTTNAATSGNFTSSSSSTPAASLPPIKCIDSAVAYVSQNPWIQHATVRNNIIFNVEGTEFTDHLLFDESVAAAQLGPDILILPQGENTEIGERGVNLSGGQKARVTIARATHAAIHHDLDLCVFDDPLSALDPLVAQSVFDQVLVGMLKGRTRVVVLNSHLHMVNNFDRVVVMDHGRIVAVATPKEMSESEEFKWVVGNNSSGSNSSTSMSSDECNSINSDDAVDIDVVEIKEEGVVDAALAEESVVVDELVIDIVQAAAAAAAAVAVAAKTTCEDDTAEQETKGDNDEIKLHTEEDRETGKVASVNYTRWFAAGASHRLRWPAFIGVISLFTLAQGARVFSDYWVGQLATVELGLGLGVFGAGFASLTIFQLGGTVFFVTIAIRSSYWLHRGLLESVLRAPVNKFFDVTPLGRIINRFSSDLNKVDVRLPQTLMELISNTIQVFATIFLCLFTSPYFFIIIPPLLGLFVLVVLYFAKTSRELKRLEGVSRSPIFSHFGEILSGLPSVRAFQKTEAMTKKHNELVDNNAKSFFIFWLAARWLAMRLDLFGIVLQCAVGCLSVGLVDSLDPALIGLALLYSIQLVNTLQFAVRQAVETENAMVSVERISFMTENIPQETQSWPVNTSSITDKNNSKRRGGDSASTPNELTQRFNGVNNKSANTIDKEEEAVVGPKWPAFGKVEFQNCSVRYRDNLDLVLRNVSFCVQAGEKCGVVGRTGAGKSTLMAMLFRLVDPFAQGRILIDGVDTMHVPLDTLRSRIALIPQDATMFSGTLRFNMDPWEVASDAQLWEMLERVELLEFVRGLPHGLETEVANNGSNFSVGQRQLISIGRALVRGAKVLLQDEATANVDSRTDALIQTTMKANFKDCTVITIAHRIDTVIDSDKILHLSHGRVAEFGSPAQLLADGKGFAEMAGHSHA